MNSKRSRSDFIFKELEKRILSWRYAPGQHLKEEELCKEFNVSRIPVREALSRLMQGHLIEKKANIGCRVKKWSIEEIHELYDFRTALECYSAEQLAVQGVPAGTFDTLLQEWQSYLPEDRSNFPEFPRVNSLQFGLRDEAFHEAVTAALGNQFILQNLTDINAKLRFLRVQDITTHERLRETSQAHIRILEAILARDAKAARELMRKNITTAKGNVEAAFKEVLLSAYMQGGVGSPASIAVS